MNHSLALEIAQLTKYYGAKLVFDNVNLTIAPRERVALVGENGVGKTTLARCVVGIEYADSGKITLGGSVGYLPQTAQFETGDTLGALLARAMGDLDALAQTLRVLEAQMTQPLPEDALARVMAQYGECLDLFTGRGGYALEEHREAVLAGLGLAHLPITQPLHTLSGGERTRAQLAALLLQAPNLLVLDEPSNHLDFAGVHWLEETLATYKGAVLMVTHDRALIDRTATHIAELSPKTRTLKRYTGDTTAYMAQRQREYEQALEAFVAQQEERARLERVIKTTTHNTKKNIAPIDGDKFLAGKMAGTADRTRSKKIQDARQRLDVLEDNTLNNPRHTWRIAFEFDPHPLTSTEPLRVAGVRKAYDGRTILHDVSLTLRKGERVVIVAPNGTGKSTLLDILGGGVLPDSGRVLLAPRAVLGYLDQDGTMLEGNLRALDILRAHAPQRDEALMASLHRSGLFADATLREKRVRDLSMGQRRKLGIARLIAMRANVLLLDEPTNHLDLASLEAFEEALVTFEGAILAVSHDRRFVERVATQVWHLEGGVLRVV